MSISPKNSPTSRTRKTIERRRFTYENVAVVSTAHITRDDGKYILDLDAPWLSHIYADGAATVFDLPEHDQAEQFKTATERYGFSEAFRDLCFVLADGGFEYVCFDRDGPVYPQFPTFDW